MTSEALSNIWTLDKELYQYLNKSDSETKYDLMFDSEWMIRVTAWLWLDKELHICNKVIPVA